MDKLRNILQEEIQKSTLFEPREGHPYRFEKKLDQKLYQKQWRIALMAIGAAVIVSILLMTVYFQLYNINYMPNTKLILAQTQQEYYEAEIYYQSKIEEKLLELAKSTSKQTYKKLVSELNDHTLDLEKLKKDLDNNPGDQRIVDAAINTYILKFEAIETLLEIIKEEKSTKDYL